MSIETEIKVEVVDISGFCGRLNALGAEVRRERHFEDNYLLDFPDRRLHSARSMLRMRFARGCSLLTYKGPPMDNEVFKIREELETGVDDGRLLLQLLERLGMTVWFRYQKFRREFAAQDVSIALDETPIGNYAEFEGKADAIRELASRMQIEERSFLRNTYYSLYLDYCRKRGVTPGFMLF